MPLEVTLTFFHRKSVPRSFKQFVGPSGDIYLNFTFFVALSVVLFNVILQSKIFPSFLEKSRV